MSIPKKRLGDILIDCNLINEDQLKEALAFQREHGLKLGEALSQMGLVTEDDIIWALGNQLNISFIHLSPDIVNPEVVKLVSADFARDNRLMPLYKAGSEFSVCMVDPLDSRPIEYLEGKFGAIVSVSICTAFDFEQTFNAVYGPLDVGSTGEVDPNATDAETKQLEQGIPKGMESSEKIINYILGQAILNKVDRIHFEPSDKGVLIRFRSNNVLNRKIEIPVKVHHDVITRLKKLSQLSEKDLTREGGVVVGHFKVNVSDRQINIQSIFYPTVNGEMVILHLNDIAALVEQIARVGKESIESVLKAVQTTHGILYVSGPRESGRTTTQYCIISSYDPEKHKLVTIEDPVVSSLANITQLQIGSGDISSSVDGLRLSLMLDADVIYVDKTDNKELLEEMCYAALGGKTILTGVLAYDASSSIIKLLETGIDPVIMASSLCGFVNQRLVRMLCPNCKKEAEIPEEIKELIPEEQLNTKVYKACGCESCNHTGYVGKVLVTEFIPATARLRQMIINKESYLDFSNFARKQGIKSIEQETLELVLKGVTTADEFMRLF